MKEFLKKIDKNDITFLIALAVFVVVAVLRYFDKALNFHESVLDVLEKYSVNKLAIITLIGVMFLFFIVCLLKIKKEDKKIIYYLSAFLSIFVCPMFVTVEYFGTMDMYAWILMFIIAICFLNKRTIWFIVPACFFMIYISPMSIINCGCLVLALGLSKGLLDNEKNYFSISFLNLIAMLIAVYISVSQTGLHMDIQHVISFKQFVVAGIMLSPYLLIAYFFFKDLVCNKMKKERLGWSTLILGSIPSIVVYVYAGDYARAIMYTFMYYIMSIMCFLSLKNENVTQQMILIKNKIKGWIPIPAIVIAYPLLFITFWIAGQVELCLEVFVG